ncbi:hypothetical protein NDU88_005753 [Pleurodeles waltl]|uniref:Uncharacterized protein n=1 Tax=Pleurodeles waltl TaxID=8319 RepID=A0AAV7MAZ4_PLEWA|nr:hypothetical protein NDU88_005753 [Pleurodeles waltl]
MQGPQLPNVTADSVSVPCRRGAYPWGRYSQGLPKAVPISLAAGAIPFPILGSGNQAGTPGCAPRQDPLLPQGGETEPQSGLRCIRILIEEGFCSELRPSAAHYMSARPLSRH